MTWVCCPKCVMPDNIVTGKKNIPIKDIQVNDVCVGKDSSENKVTRKFERDYEGIVYRIKAAGILPIEVTPEHPILTLSLRGGFGRWDRVSTCKHISFKKPVELMEKHHNNEGDYLLIPRHKGSLDTTSIDLSNLTTERGLIVCKSKNVPLIFSINDDTAWLLGLYIAEGCSSDRESSFCLGSHEHDIIKRATNIIEKMGYSTRVYSKGSVTVVAIQSRLIARALTVWCGKGASNKHFPYFIIDHKNDEILRSCINGYLQGDGHVDKKRNKTSAVSVSRTLALQLQMLSARLGDFFGIYKNDNKSTGIIMGRKVNLKQQYLMRKVADKRSFTRVLEDYIAVPIRSVESFNYEGKVYNLETEDHTFTIHNAIVHNCSARWDWNGESNLVTCYKCRHQWKVEIPKYAVAQEEQSRTVKLDKIELPEGMSLNTIEGQKWLMQRIQVTKMKIMDGEELTPAEALKYLESLKDDCVKIAALIEHADIEKGFNELEKKNKPRQ